MMVTCLPGNCLSVVVEQLLLLPAVVHLHLDHLTVLRVVKHHIQVSGLAESEEILERQGILVVG